MKILFVVTHLTTFGGVGKVILDYANKFCEQGHQVGIIAQKIDIDNYRFLDNIVIIEIGGPLPKNPLHWIFLNKIRKKYQNVIQKLKPNILFSHNFPSNYYCLNLKIPKNCKHIYYCYEPYRLFHDKRYYQSSPFLLKYISKVLRFFYKKYDMIATKNVDAIICISLFTKRRIKEVYNCEAILIYPILNINQFNKSKLSNFSLYKHLGLKKNQKIVFALGLSHHMKGARELILIFNIIHQKIPDLILLIGGWISRSNYRLLKRTISKCNLLSNMIIFYGSIESDKLKYFYKESSLTLYTAIDEPFGLIPLESMIYGTPVIAFKGGPSETIINGKTGYVVRYNEINDFAEKAIKIIKNKAYKDSFSKYVENEIIKNFSFKESYLKLESIFKKI